MNYIFFATFLFPFSLIFADLTFSEEEAIDSLMKKICSVEIQEKNITEIYGFNQIDRDAWIAELASKVPKGSKILDVGAGTCPYRSLFSHCEYFSHDAKCYEGEKLGGATKYGEIDFVSDVTNIPVEDDFFDVVICTEVLEHVPHPDQVLYEISRILKKGGCVFLSAPFACGLHQEPYHFYTGFTPYWYQKFLPEAGMKITKITPNNGFFKYLAQENTRFLGLWELHKSLYPEETHICIKKLFGELLPRFLYQIDENCSYFQFTVGYHVEAIKQ
ncbi:MAG: methyltransferase domain-containing protein [Chlamydiae bacterium]|nr:methyltransferase domain-containing protein [Chlamydiota bacterium]